jgi:CBS domain-containing protein
VQVREILSAKGLTEVFTIQPDATVADLLNSLADRNVGALIVSTDGIRMDGIVSERDVVRTMRNLPDPSHLTVRDIMTEAVHICAPDDTLGDVMGTMTEYRVRHVPVLDDGILVGILSIGDAVKSRMDQLEFERDQLTHYLHGQ